MEYYYGDFDVRLRKCRCSLVISTLTANSSFSIRLSRGVVFAGDWCHHQQTAPLFILSVDVSSGLVQQVWNHSCGHAHRGRRTEPLPLNPVSSIMYHDGCILYISFCVCALYRALTKTLSPSKDQILFYSLVVLKTRTLVQAF